MSERLILENVVFVIYIKTFFLRHENSDLVKSSNYSDDLFIL